MSFFPDEQREQISLDLSLSLKAVIAQRLIPTINGGSRRVAVEILLNTPLIANHILRNEIHEIKAVIGRSNQQGMRTFDQSLFQLYQEGIISYEEALRHADSANELRLMIKLNKTHDPTSSFTGALTDITLMDQDSEPVNFSQR